MANAQNRRVQMQVLQADQDTLVASKVFVDYQPANRAYSVEGVTADYEAMRAALAAELHAQNSLAAARDASVASQWKFHNSVLALKDQVLAQYGPDSDEVAALGLKKKSERKAPVRPVRPVA